MCQARLRRYGRRQQTPYTMKCGNVQHKLSITSTSGIADQLLPTNVSRLLRMHVPFKQKS
eukprot:1728828-Amphidinium_carterae.2